jgi:beta-lactamase class A
MLDLNFFFKRILPFLVLLLLISNIFLLFFLFKTKSEINALEKDIMIKTNQFSLISPQLAWMDVDSFLQIQKQYAIHYYPLKESIVLELNDSSLKGEYGVYFEDLNTGASIGIDEKKKFFPRSLFKVPVMVTILKKIQEGEITLNTTVYLSKEDLNSESGELFTKGVGYPITVKELLEIMIWDSDNTAMSALANRFKDDALYLEVTSIMGLPYPEGGIAIVSPKEYSNIFRSLYFSNYLKRSFSNLALSILLETDFNDQLVSGVPEDIKISHKFGEDAKLKYYHDCGIIYFPEKPYILCVMSKGSTKEEANSVISNISKVVYEYISNERYS